MENRAFVETRTVRIENNEVRQHLDKVATEEPMEIRIIAYQEGIPRRHSIAVTMRTPDHDFELTAGFLFTEGILSDPGSIERIDFCRSVPEEASRNVVNVFLQRDVAFDPKQFSRNVYTSSSCGICGKTSLEMVRVACSGSPVGSVRLEKEFLLQLPQSLIREQTLFSETGGLHASALFDKQGRLLLIREDVGRHNALDKVVGALFLENSLPVSDSILLLSGRASYELIQKAVMAGIPVVAAVGAPSSLAIEMAREFDVTLVGFLRDGRFNVYSGSDRIVGANLEQSTTSSSQEEINSRKLP